MPWSEERRAAESGQSRARIVWTDEMVATVRLLRTGGATIGAIAAVLGIRSHKPVIHQMDRMGLSTKRQVRPAQVTA